MPGAGGHSDRDRGPAAANPAQSWRCCLSTADETTISLACPLRPGEPWVAGRALDVLRLQGGIAAADGAARYAVGRRQGPPLILGEPLSWRGVALTLEAQQLPGSPQGELTLRLPPWEQFFALIAEPELWELVDRLALEFSARLGVVSDGRAVGYPDLERPGPALRRLQRRHLGLLLAPEHLPDLRPGTTPYLRLERSSLLLVLE